MCGFWNILTHATFDWPGSLFFFITDFTENAELGSSQKETKAVEGGDLSCLNFKSTEQNLQRVSPFCYPMSLIIFHLELFDQIFQSRYQTQR